MVLGEGERFLSALIQIDLENTGRWATFAPAVVHQLPQPRKATGGARPDREGGRSGEREL